jgi:hypothetical protein
VSDGISVMRADHDQVPAHASQMSDLLERRPRNYSQRAGHDVHGDGSKDTQNQANNERTAFHRTALPPLLLRLLPNETELSRRLERSVRAAEVSTYMTASRSAE